MAALFGSLAEYDPDKEEWPQYATHLDHFFAANAIKEADKKKDIFLSILGPQTFKLLSSLVAPAKPGEKTYKDLVAVLQEHYCPEPLKWCSASSSMQETVSQEKTSQHMWLNCVR